MNKNILLVEDEYLIALNGIAQLENIGYKTFHAINGEIAIEMATNPLNAIDLILMDIDLGSGIDGTETAKIILEKFELPILFLSSRTEKEIITRTEKNTSFGYVAKNSNITVIDASIKMAFKLFEAHQKIQFQNHQLENLNNNLILAKSKLDIQNKELLSIQKDLKENRKMFLDMVDNVPGVIYQFCVRSDGSSYFKFISEKVKEIFGLPDDKTAPEWDLGAQIPIEDREKFLKSIETSVLEIKNWSYEGRIYTGNGDLKSFLGKSIPSFIGDEIVFNGILIDTSKK
jgi:DNA-binding response OmpR family regulator